MDKRFLICGLVTGIVALVLDFLIHGLLLRADYAALVPAGLIRGPEHGARYLPWMLLAHLCIGFGLTALYRAFHPRATSDVRQGLRFGALMALTVPLPGYLVYYAVQPWPGMVVLKQIVLSALAMLLLGLLLAWLQPRRRVL
ncbi:hypothetical protein [Luteimonas sp. e5]